VPCLLVTLVTCQSRIVPALVSCKPHFYVLLLILMLYHTSVCFTVKSLENTCHTWALLRWWFTTKRRYIKCMHLYLFTFTFTNKFDCLISWIGLFTECTISICLICLSVALYHSVARVKQWCAKYFEKVFWNYKNKILLQSILKIQNKILW